MKKYLFETLPPIPDFGVHSDNVTEISQRSVAIHNDATICLKIVKDNVESYVDMAQTIMTMALEGGIASTNNECFIALNKFFNKIKEQFDEVASRYNNVENNFHTDAYVGCALLGLDENASLGIYNKQRMMHNPDYIQSEVQYIIENSEPNPSMQEEVRNAAAQSVYQCLTKEPKNDSRFSFVKSDKTFKDVAGLTEVKEDLMQIVDFIKRPNVYKQFGAKLPKGTILYGPPGTGKTLLARAVAGEAQAKFIALSSTDFTASKWGEVPKMIKELFEMARQHAPCIIFIDEIDMLGLDRGADKANSLAHRESLNAFLSAMDGFDQYEGVTVMAATNRLEDLDSAMMRPGRFDNLFAVPLPHDIKEVQEVVEIYMRNKKFDSEVKTIDVARKMLRHSPASIESILNEACLVAIKKNNGIIRECDINEAVLKKTIKGHVRENANIPEDDSKLVAIHEAGHALVAVYEGIPVQSVTIIGTTTGAGGLTMMDPSNKSYFRKSDYEKQIRISYGGRAAEQLAFGSDMITTGASADIRQATNLIEYASVNFGFNLADSKSHAPVVYKNLSQNNLEKAANKYYAETVEILKANIEALKAVATELLHSGTITGERVKQIFDSHQAKDMVIE